MIILMPDGSVQQTGRHFGRLSIKLAALLVPLGGIFATIVVGVLGL